MELDIKAVKTRFLAINRERLKRTQNALRWKQRDFLELLPILFHINHAMLPGFVSKSTPAGIPLFLPSKKGLDALKKLAKSFTYKRRALRTYDIQSIFIMGSVGTIAHSEKSDFDIWVCHNPELTTEQLGELRSKCCSIEQWADGLGLEVHFFLMDAEKFKQGEVHELSSESAGTTQHHLLLEEFYRTSLLVAGRYPVWWLVPPDQEVNYEDFVADLLHKRFVPKHEVIDFGGLSHIPAEEFFGAALWQVYKGIDSPYKSVLKILLMETYASAYPDIELLSMQYKSMVYDGIKDLNYLDPYNVLVSKLEQYLTGNQSVERLELVRRCFYFKVNIPLSHKSNSNDDWRREVLNAMVKKWKWTQAHIAMLDTREEWKINRVLLERKTLVDELTNSYLFLSKFARENTQSLSRISQKDLNILGRKLYAAFERKAGKIELVNRGVSTNVVERKLTIQQNFTRDGEQSWSLHNEVDGANGETKLSTIKRGRSAAEIIAWCHFNRLISPGTVIVLDIKNGILSLKEAKAILAALDDQFPRGTVPSMDIDDFSQPPRIIGGSVFTNVGLDPLPKHTQRGTDIVSDRTDILNFSGFSFNLALSFDLVLITSWQEILTYRYSGVDGLLHCLCQYLRWHLNSPTPIDFELPAFSFCSTHSTAIANRIQQLFKDVVDAFYKKNKLRKLRYVVEVQNSNYILTVENDNFTFKKAKSLEELYALLSQPQSEFIPIQADRFALTQSVLPLVLLKNKPGKIQLFYEPVGSNANIFVLDEYGSLFFQNLPFHDDHALLNQYMLFFSSVSNRQSIFSNDTINHSSFEEVEYCKVIRVANGKCRFERKYISPESRKKRYFHVQVISNTVDQKTVFTVYCEDDEFSSFDHGKSLFAEVAKHVYKRRASGAKYPIYITDLDLAPNLLGDRVASAVQIIEFLNYKKHIEETLNKELARL